MGKLESVERVEQRLRNAADTGVQTISTAAKQLMAAGGKRIRPRFALAFGEAIGAEPHVAETIGVSVELLHTGSLIHDDIIDQSSFRRNQPALHTKIGVIDAVLTGDFLLARALEQATLGGCSRSVGDLVQALRELVEAEILQHEIAFRTDVAPEQARKVAEGKTGALFACCARALAREKGLPADLVEAADQIGRTFGTAFQLGDDLLDFSDAPVGKPQWKDLREGRFTLPVILAAQQDAALHRAVQSAFQSRADADFALAYGLLRRSTASNCGQSEIRRCCETIALKAGEVFHAGAHSDFLAFCCQSLETGF